MIETSETCRDFRVRWTSHRGVHHTYPENSQLAFLEAVRLGFDCLETDLRTTKDGVIVLHHDSSLKRTFGLDAIIEDMNYRDLQPLALPDGQRLLTLDSLIESHSDKHFIFDIKAESGQRTLEVLAKQDILNCLDGRVRLLFWDIRHEKFARKEWPKIEILANEKDCLKAGLLALVCWPGKVADAGKTYSLTPSFYGLPLFRDSIVRRYHTAGAKLIAYLPETSELARRAVESGFDEILSDGLILNQN